MEFCSLAFYRSQYDLKRLMVPADALLQFPADSPRMVAIQMVCKQKHHLKVVNRQIDILPYLEGLLCLISLDQFLLVEIANSSPQLGNEHTEKVYQFAVAHPDLSVWYSQTVVIVPRDDISFHNPLYVLSYTFECRIELVAKHGQIVVELLGSNLGVYLGRGDVGMPQDTAYTFDGNTIRQSQGPVSMAPAVVVKPKINGRQMNAIRDVKR